MKVYLESSAVLSWLLDERASAPIRDVMERATILVASELTILESERVLVRAEATGQLGSDEARDRRTRLRRASRHWHVHLVRTSAMDRACLAFPVEPVRSLDALHLACAAELRHALPGLAILSLDRRIIENAKALGFDILDELVTGS